MLRGVTQGIRDGIAINNDIRAERQRRLKNYVDGFELDKASGEYRPNDRGMLALATQQERLKQALMQSMETTQQIEDLFSARGMTEATSYLLAGRASDANKVLETNPILKKRLQASFGVNTVQPFDLDNDIAQIEEDLNIEIDREKLKDPKVREALQSAFFKTIHQDGKVSINSTEDLIRQTNYNGYVDNETKQAAQMRLKKINDLLRGIVKTDSEYQLEQNAVKAKNSQVNLAGDTAQAQLDEMHKWFKENPNKTYSDYLNYLASKQPKAPTDPYKLAQEKAKADKAKIELEKSKIGLEKSKVDLEKSKVALQEYKKELDAKSKGKPSKDIISQGEYDFVANINNKPLNNETYSKAKEIEAKNIKLGIKPTTEEMKTAAQMPKFVNRFRKLSKELDKIPRNAWVKASSEIEKITGILTSPFKSDAEKRKAIKETISKWKFDSKIGSAMADYIKFMSGAAVTDAEFNRYTNLLIGGNWNSKQSAKASLQAFTQALTEKALGNLEGIKFKAPYSYLIYRQQLGITNTSSTSTSANKKSITSKDGYIEKTNKYSKHVNILPSETTKSISNKQRPPLESFKGGN